MKIYYQYLQHEVKKNSWKTELKHVLGFDFHGEYIGKEENGKPHGFGVFHDNKRKTSFFAKWKNGVPEGKVVRITEEYVSYK